MIRQLGEGDEPFKKTSEDLVPIPSRQLDRTGFEKLPAVITDADEKAAWRRRVGKPSPDLLACQPAKRAW